ncbi:MAG: DNA polymerase III subunit gamma/tau [Anaerotruncus sp.]|nr:MAG: DNA polymerase III subunit gamma/tau [Anaerotruncus sp.]
MYQVLYRKYRPKVFADVYGQEHITSTLINEIKEGRVSHAYLFTGSRGTGKTTCAKILAKAVNCEHNENGEPCNECEICKGLDDGTIYDVVEIDAASNNGVDNIRDLREEANYTPSRGKYRVFIIDEVHMLSTGAFNALLKTLEEPPEHVIFILATTEVHKLPATILSRCQRFDFKRIQPETMAIRLKQVAGFENMRLSDEAAILIARIADGGMRDALSILDQCAGRSKDIDEKLVSEVAGIAGREALYELSQAVAAKSSGAALDIIAKLHANSYDMERLCVEMINHYRNFLIVKTVNKNRGLIICTDDEYNSILSGAQDYTLTQVIYALDLFQDTLVKIKGGANSRIEMEMSFIKLCEPKLDSSVESILSRLSQVENAVRRGISSAPQGPQAAESAHARQVPEPKKETAQSTNNLPEQKPQPEDLPWKEDFDSVSEKAATAKENAAQHTPSNEDLPPDIFNADEAPLPPEPPVHRAEPTPPAQSHAPAQNGDQVLFDGWAEFMDEIYKKRYRDLRCAQRLSRICQGRIFSDRR